MTVEEVQGEYDKTLGPNTPQWGSFSREYVGFLLEEVKRLKNERAEALKALDFLEGEVYKGFAAAAAEEREVCKKIIADNNCDHPANIERMFVAIDARGK